MEFILQNAESLMAIIGGLVTVASLIVALTPSNKDDKVVGIIKGLLQRLSMVKDNEGVK